MSTRPLTLWPVALGAIIGCALVAPLVGADQALTVLGAQLLTLGLVWATNSWQPIETAPRDGTEILVYAPSYRGLRCMSSVCAWHEDDPAANEPKEPRP